MGILQTVKGLFWISVEKIKETYVKVKNALTSFFIKALDMMKTVIVKLANKVRGVILGSAHFIRKVGNKYQEGTRNYSLEQEIGLWHETTVTRNLDLEDVPQQYRTMEEEFEIDDTMELDAALA